MAPTDPLCPSFASVSPSSPAGQWRLASHPHGGRPQGPPSRATHVGIRLDQYGNTSKPPSDRSAPVLGRSNVHCSSTPGQPAASYRSATPAIHARPRFGHPVSTNPTIQPLNDSTFHFLHSSFFILHCHAPPAPPDPRRPAPPATGHTSLFLNMSKNDLKIRSIHQSNHPPIQQSSYPAIQPSPSPRLTRAIKPHFPK